MAKKATYKVEFSFDNLSLAEQDRVYQKLMGVLDRPLKDALRINITDLIGGQHDPFYNKGIRPDKIECINCYNVDCASCKVWNKVLDYNKERENKDNE